MKINNVFLAHLYSVFIVRLRLYSLYSFVLITRVVDKLIISIVESVNDKISMQYTSWLKLRNMKKRKRKVVKQTRTLVMWFKPVRRMLASLPCIMYDLKEKQ